MVLQHFENGGGSLAVDVEGNGPLVICCPGMGDIRQAYTEFSAYLVSKGYTVAVMDPRGHGDSTPQFDAYGDAATAEDFIFLAEKLNKSPAVLVGCSFAGGAATIAAGKRPDLVAGTILLGAFLRNGMGAWFLYVLSLMFWRPWGPAMWQFYAATLWPGLGDRAKKRAAESRAHLTRPQRWSAFQKTVAGCDHSVVEPWINKVQAPVLVVMGEKDPDFGKPVEEAAWIASNFKDVETVMVPDVGHGPMVERPEFVGEKCVAFLERLKNKGAFGSGR